MHADLVAYIRDWCIIFIIGVVSLLNVFGWAKTIIHARRMRKPRRK